MFVILLIFFFLYLVSVISGQLSSSRTVRFSLAQGDKPRCRIPWKINSLVIAIVLYVFIVNMIAVTITIIISPSPSPHHHDITDLIGDELAVWEGERLKAWTVSGELVITKWLQWLGKHFGYSEVVIKIAMITRMIRKRENNYRFRGQWAASW